MYYAIVISVPIFIVRIYTVLPFLPAFGYTDTAVLLVLVFFTLVQLPWKYHILLAFTQDGQASQGNHGKWVRGISTWSGKSGKVSQPFSVSAKIRLC